jgi:hypothetical protein
MPAPVNLTTKFSDKVAERISKMSMTDGAASQEYTFAGIKTLEVYSVDVVALQNYNRAASSNRYGTPAELGDGLQAFTMTQDKSFTYTIDKGNEAEQMNIKKANESLTREIDEIIVPTLDKYRFEKWSQKAGSVHVLTGAVNSTSVIGLIMDSTEILDNYIVPSSGRTLYVTTAVYKSLKQNPDFVGSEGLIGSSRVRGIVGEIDGMTVVKVPSSYFPAGVNWIITYKSAILAPKKLADYKIHVDPPGISGNLIEGRIMHDAFVIGAKGNAVLVAVTNGAFQANAPTFTANVANTIIATTTVGAFIYFTSDGTDPRYSMSATNTGANSYEFITANLDSTNNPTDSNGAIFVKAAAFPPLANNAIHWSNVTTNGTNLA